MSASGGYDYSYVNRELQARRRLRARLAELGVRAELLADQAERTAGRRSGVTVTWQDPAEDAPSAALETAVREAEDILEEAERQVDELFTRALLADLGCPTATRPEDVPAKVAHQEPALHQAPELKRVRAAAHARAEQMLRRDGRRCDATDLDELRSVLQELAEAPDVDRVRRGAADFERRVAVSIKARARREEDVLTRARLRTLVDQAPAARRAALRAAIESDTDLESLTELVGRAVAEADRDAAPAAGAAAAADALSAIGCEVGADFASVLASDGESIVALDDARWSGDRYALLVRMDPAARRLYTAVVRKAGEPADPDADVAAQRRYCDEGIPALLQKRMAAGGVRLHEALRLEPGRRPIPTVEAGRWPAGRRAIAPDAERAKDAAKPETVVKPRPAARPAARERRRER